MRLSQQLKALGGQHKANRTPPRGSSEQNLQPCSTNRQTAGPADCAEGACRDAGAPHSLSLTVSLLLRLSSDLGRSLYRCRGGVLGMPASARILTSRARMLSKDGLWGCVGVCLRENDRPRQYGNILACNQPHRAQADKGAPNNRACLKGASHTRTCLAHHCAQTPLRPGVWTLTQLRPGLLTYTTAASCALRSQAHLLSGLGCQQSATRALKSAGVKGGRVGRKPCTATLCPTSARGMPADRRRQAQS